jgi:hypothetical protein
MLPILGIPLPLPDERIPTEDELPELKSLNERLQAYSEPVTWTCTLPAEQNCSVLVWLMFTGGIAIDEKWCRFFRAEFVTKECVGWIARPAFVEPNAPGVCLMPLHDQIDLGAAMYWAPRADKDPIVKATVGFIGVHPMRVFTFQPKTIH